ncbi:MAG: collagen-like protein [Flavobacteriales bacterium]|nr:collagen-like protein [Flavobacteriales bacterium]
MKKLAFLTTLILNSSFFIHHCFAQAPQMFNYQGVARDNAGNTLVNQNIGVQFDLRETAANGTVVYSETHTATTNNFGLFNLQVGNGTPSLGTLASIDWSNGPFFLEVSLDANGGTNYQSMGVSQLLSVPYALYAETSGNAGPTGPTGPQGIQGLQGPTGAQGMQGPTGIAGSQGPIGPTGPQGPAGADGTSVTIQGSVATSNDLPGSANTGDGYIAQDSGNLWVWDGTQWVDAGQIQGPAGPTGPQGPTGAFTALADGDSDTKIQVEESADEDIIRFDVGGEEAWRMEDYRIVPGNNGGAVIVGRNAGLNDAINVGDPTYSVFIGENAGRENTIGEENVAVGPFALRQNQTGERNVAIGSAVLTDMQGSRNVAVGSGVMSITDSGEDNVGIGADAMGGMANGNFNVAIGRHAGNPTNNSDKTGGTYLGHRAGYLNKGNYNVFIGHEAGYDATPTNDFENVSNTLVIANQAGEPDEVLIYGEFDNQLVAINGTLRVNDGTQQNGYVLTSDANGNASWQAGGGGIAGPTGPTGPQGIQGLPGADGATGPTGPLVAGTAGQTLRNNGSGWVANGNLFNTGNRIGVGTTSPDARLHVASNAAGDADGVKITQSNYNSLVYHNDLGDLVLKKAIIPNQLVLDGNGGVGIGTDSVLAQLHVAGNVLIDDGTQQAGYVLTSDADGLASWQAPSGGSGTSNLLEDADGDTQIELIDAPQLDSMVLSFDNEPLLSLKRDALDNLRFNLIGATSTNNNIFFGGNNAIPQNLEGIEDNVVIGRSAGKNLGSVFTASSQNLMVGHNAAEDCEDCDNNVVLGSSAGGRTINMRNNVIIGLNAGRGSTNNSTVIREGNTIIGYQAGENLEGSGNVFIGNRAGANETGNNMLYIDNDDTSAPLIKGSFSTGYVRINGDLEVEEDLDVAGNQIVNGETELNGNVRINDGSQQDNYVLTSDIDGNASWQSIAASLPMVFQEDLTEFIFDNDNGISTERATDWTGWMTVNAGDRIAVDATFAYGLFDGSGTDVTQFRILIDGQNGCSSSNGTVSAQYSDFNEFRGNYMPVAHNDIITAGCTGEMRFALGLLTGGTDDEQRVTRCIMKAVNYKH